MPAIFISHSSVDRQVSGDVKAALDRLGYEHTFLDFDKETGLDIGADWEKRLYEELIRCHAVILLLTPAWLASKWCFAELTQARALGKVILPVLCQRVEGRMVLPDIQAVDLVDWNAGGLERLEQRLQAITNELARGFTLDPTRPPYPGINAFQKEDAAIYFGRDEESRAVLERLDARRTQGGARFVVIIGASGSGKSSLLKASVLPLLNRRRAQWVILPDIRPEKAPMEALAKALAQHVGKPETWRDWHATLSGPDGVAALERFVQDARIGEARAATVLLPIDQFEECFTTTPAAERAAFLGLLQGVFARDLPFMVIATGRSDVLEGLIESSELVGHYETFPLTAMPIERYPRLIEGPAAVAGIIVETGLSERISRDVESKEALPLLAHMLALLYQRGGENKKLSLAEYELLGDPARGLTPIQNSIRLAADEAIARLKPNERELGALRDAFVPHLVRVRLDDGKRVRQTARRSELPPEALRLIGALTEARLLMTRTGEAGQEREPLVEVTHELLFKAWPTLDQWLTEEQAFLTDLERIRAAQENWANELLYGLLLSRAREWLLKYPQRFIGRDMEPVRAFVAESAQVADAERTRAQRIRRRVLQGAIAAIVLLGATTTIAGFQWYEAITQTQLANSAKERADKSAVAAQIERDQARMALLAIQARRANAEADTPDGIERAAALALESIEIARKGNHVAEADAIEAARNALIRLPLLMLPHGSRVLSLAVLPDGRLASGSDDDKIKLWPKDGTGEPRVLPHGGRIWSLAVLTDGRLVSGGEDGKIRIWPTDGIGEPVLLPHGSGVQSLAVLTDGRLVSGGEDGKIRIWPTDGIGEPVLLPHGSRVLSLVVLPDGRLASAGDHGQIKVWPKGGVGEPLILTDGDETLKLTVLADGRLASAGDHGQIKLWPKDGTGEPVVLPHGSRIWSLVVLADGRLASAGNDGKITLWPMDNTGEPVVLSHGSGPVWSLTVLSLAVLTDGRLASGGEDGKIRIWPKDGTGEPVVLPNDRSVKLLAVLADGRLASADDDGKIKLWPKDGIGEPVVLSRDRQVWSLAALTDGRLASSGYDQKIKLWPKDGIGSPVVLSHGGLTRALAVLPDGRLASGGDDGKIKLWPKDGIGEPVVLLAGNALVDSLAVLRDGRLASAGNDGQVRLWPKDGIGEPLILLHGQVQSLAALADGRLASADDDGKIKLWPKDGIGEPLILLHGNRVQSLAALADGRLASAGDDGQVRLWPKDGIGKPVVLPHGSVPVRSLVVLGDGRLASAGDDGKIKLWPKDGIGEPVVLFHGNAVRLLAVLTDGRLASAGDDRIKLWLVDEHKLIAALCLRPGRHLTKDEWTRYIGSDTSWQPSCRDHPSNWRTPD